MASKFTLFAGFLFLTLNTVFSQETLNDRTLYVRFKEGSRVQLTDNRISVNQSSDLISLSNHGQWRKTYFISEEKMDSLRAVAEKNLNKKLPNLNLDYRFIVNSGENIEEIISSLSSNSSVRSVIKAPKFFNTSAPDYMPLQSYLYNGTHGINAEAVWTDYNNHGEGVKICDIEYFFNENHIDLPFVDVLGVTPEDPFGGGGGDHGTAVLGEIGSLNDGIGTTGISFGSELFFAGCYYAQSYELENALLQASMNLGVGDVVLIEQQIDGPNYNPNAGNQFGLVPVEWISNFYDAIQLCIGQGIIVVEAAGNGQQNLDDEIYTLNNWGHYPFYPGNGSGAIIVGAGSVGTTDVERSTMWFSNYGSAVSVQGNGESIYSTGYGDLFSDSQNELYTSDFGGTSGASPIVTGAVALLISTVQQEAGLTLTRDQIVDIFILTGQAQTDGSFAATDAHIGPLPNVKAAIDYALTSLNVIQSEEEILSVYPNPSNGTFVLNFNPKLEQVKVHDISGKEIPFQLNSVSENYSYLKMDEASSGIYTLSVETNNQFQTLKLVVE